MGVATNKATHATIRWMMKSDLPRVLDIEFESFESPLLEEDMLKILRCQMTVGLVAEVDDVIAGFVLYDLKMRTCIELIDIAVAPEFRRQRIGTQLIDKLTRKPHPCKRSSLRIDVWERNVAAQLFFQVNGFVCTHTIHDAYEGTDDAAYRMVFACDID